MEALDTLVTAAQAGDLNAFSDIVQRFQGMAYVSAYTMLGDVQMAEDVEQEAFIEAYLHLPALREPQAFPGWFRRIVFRQGDRLLRNQKVTTVPLEPTTAVDALLEELNPVNIVEQREMQTVVRHAISTLPEHERMVVLLFYGSGYTLNDISQFLEVPLSTSKKRLFDARKHLKARLSHTVYDTLQEQHLSWPEHFPLKVQLFIAIRLDDGVRIKELLNRNPLLVSEKWASHERRYSQHSSATFTLPIGYTPLHEAARREQSESAAILLDYGANVNSRTLSGITPLHEAVQSNQLEVARFLLAHGAQVNLAAADGMTPLHKAVIKGYLASTWLLLEQHALVNAQTSSGRTPLHWAALKGYNAIVELLLNYGAALDLRDELDRTALDWAYIRKQDSIVHTLRNYKTLDQQSLALLL